ncbi:MAG: bifunctional precorrin-2 dehydrogenase/sirohydrochlorin ferrochelatase, partial [Thermodesulfovibrionales bacterium]|nr:bifunctional precorrin-2 dehydrogenase/sirohydrochlorin ferrochelatase [Thermodesulfovibrionales bacterium]
MPSYYPVFLNISGKDCLVIGGGKIAERKMLSLLKAEAKITVISETLTKKLKNEFEKGNIRFIQKSFDIEDIKTAFLVIAATSDNETNKLIALNSPFLVNVVDNPTLSNFIVPSVVSKKPLTIAISTEGSSPSFASVIKKDIESLYG